LVPLTFQTKVTPLGNINCSIGQDSVPAIQHTMQVKRSNSFSVKLRNSFLRLLASEIVALGSCSVSHTCNAEVSRTCYKLRIRPTLLMTPRIPPPLRHCVRGSPCWMDTSFRW